MSRTDVLIVGAGPTGLVLALWLCKLAVRVRLIDKAAQPGTTSRALAVQARTLELYRQLDLARAVVERGHKVPAVSLWAKGKHAARLSLESIGHGLTPYSFLEIFPQDEHEKLLIQRLSELGCLVERRTELRTVSDEGDHVVAHLVGPDGREEVCQARYVAGCDGARSSVRQALGIDFPGGTYRQIFYVADVHAQGPAVNGELHVDLDEADFLAVFPLAAAGRVRLIGTVRDERADHAATLEFGDVSGHAIEHLKVEVTDVNWFSTYHVHHRVAERLRKGRAFLLGDAAHVHSPVGGQGMNTGIGDAINLAWKLAAVLRAQAGDGLLDSYEPERIAFARRLVATTDRAFSFVTADGRLADIVRTRIAPAVLSRIAGFDKARELMFRTISQLTLNYRGMPLSAGYAGHVHGGDRLPWAPCRGLDNFDTLIAIAWQVHIYGAANEELCAWCALHGIAVHAFDWHHEHEAAGLVQNAAYLLRPDTYIALVDPTAHPQVLERYFAERQIVMRADSAT
jgi:2-polyprenyl-6-methoxyphenol hydroxylase-like FAD-dependent oxidoreductase